MTTLSFDQLNDVVRVMAEYNYFKSRRRVFNAPFKLIACNTYAHHKPIDAIEWTENGSRYTAEFSVFKTNNCMSFAPILTRNDEDVGPAAIHESLSRMAKSMGLSRESSNGNKKKI